MNPFFLNGKFTPELMTELVFHLIRCPEFMQLAYNRLTPSDFPDYSLEFKFVYRTAWNHFKETRTLPPQRVYQIEIESLRATECNLDVFGVEAIPKIQALVTYFFDRTDFNLDQAKRLLQQFILQMQFSNRLLFAADRKYIEPREWEAMQAGLLNADLDAASGLDTALHSAACLLRDPATFAPVEYISTGYRKLDGVLGGGLAPGEVSTLFGPVAMGKTSFMANLMLNMAKNGSPTLVFSLEMAAADIVKLAVAIQGNIARGRLRAMRLRPEDQISFNSAFNQIAQYPLYILDRKAFITNPKNLKPPTMQILGDLIVRSIERHSIKMVFVDYLAKVGPHDAEETRRMAQLNDWALTLARLHKIHIVALAQQNKASFGNVAKRTGRRSVGMQDVRGVIESVADPDNVIALVRDDWNKDEPKDPAEMRAVVLKARYGPGGQVPFRFHKTTGVIAEMVDQTVVQPEPEPARVAADGHSELQV